MSDKHLRQKKRRLSEHKTHALLDEGGVAFSLCSMRSQLWQMQDGVGAAVLRWALGLPALAGPVLRGWAQGHVVES